MGPSDTHIFDELVARRCTHNILFQKKSVVYFQQRTSCSCSRIFEATLFLKLPHCSSHMRDCVRRQYNRNL